MAEQQMISAVVSSSNSSSMPSSKKYDVFLSFRGDNTRKNFTSHLYEALKQKKVETYIDNQLEKGDEISPALLKAIEDSHVSIVILSENYASSKWCLEELSKIMECKKDQGLVVIPVFYNIDPSHVRKQIGSYKKPFAKKHKGEPRCNKWKAALTEVANLAGWDSRDRIESEFIKEIVGYVLQKLPPRYSYQLKGLVGIEENYQQIESLLKIGSSEARIVGIWGMGGIGKTTLAAALYAKMSHEFEGSCLLANVREESDNHGLKALSKRLFSELLENENHCFDAPLLVPHFIKSRLRRKKVFIVLDDVATTKQLETLIDCDFLGPRSRVIVTTRNKQILSQVDEIYEVKELSFHHSLQLFCLTVFREKQPIHGYEDLSRSVVSYCKGLPLAVKVLGARLRSRRKEAWKSELRKVQDIPNMEIHDILKLSYDDLDCFEKKIFLDIACFFKGEERDWVTSLLDACNFYAEFGIEKLLDYALVTILDHNKIEMHDLIQEMGWKIVRQESIEDLGSRSRLWRPEDVHEVLKDNKGTEAVEGIILDLSKLTGDLNLSSNVFAKMPNLRFLQIHHGYQGIRFNVFLPNDLESLSNKLRCLHWDGFCLESLPPNFCAAQLVELSMPNSKLKKLWDGVQDLVNLKKIDLSRSKDLIELSDLSKAKKLETAKLVGCGSLRQVHPSMLSLPKLTHLYLCGCREIRSLNVHSKSLRVLEVDRCSSLKEILVTSEELTELDLSNTAICALPSSMLSLPMLAYLHLGKCREIESLKTNTHSKSLRVLSLNGCSSLKEFSMTSEVMTRLDLSHTAICALPSSIWRNTKLVSLSLNGCNNLDKISDDPRMGFIEPNLSQSDKHNWLHRSRNASNMRFLQVLDLRGTSVESLPANIKDFPMLRVLWLNDCKKLVSLPDLPPFVESISAVNCTSLETDFTQRLVLQHMLQSLIPDIHEYPLTSVYDDHGYFIFPGDHVAEECGFRTAKSSMTIPYLPKSYLCGFIYCIILSKESSSNGCVSCSISQDDGKKVGDDNKDISFKNLISDHVLFWYHDFRKFYITSEACDQFSNVTFMFRNDQESIKECGVFPVYASESGLKLFGSSSSKDIFESESITQISDNESKL